MNLLVVIDMQNDFISGVLGSKEARDIVPNVVREMTSNNYQSILLTMDTHAANYLDTYEGINLPIRHCVYPSTGWALNDRILINRPAQGGLFLKPGFGSPELINEIVKYATSEEGQKDPLESVTFVGLCTDICVMTNAIMLRGALPDLPIYYVADACAATTPEKQQAAFDIFESCQIYPKKEEDAS